MVSYKLRQQAAGSRQQAAGSRQQAAGSRQQAAGSRQQAAVDYNFVYSQISEYSAFILFLSVLYQYQYQYQYQLKSSIFNLFGLSSPNNIIFLPTIFRQLVLIGNPYLFLMGELTLKLDLNTSARKSTCPTEFEQSYASISYKSPALFFYYLVITSFMKIHDFIFIGTVKKFGCEKKDNPFNCMLFFT